jgi:TolB-like protein/DNA-binding winged helix-turn-helix (wHTH) protein/Tfp pilus assembly protein PilF
MDKPSLLLDNWQVSPQEGTLSRDDETVHLEPRVMDVLVYLAQRAGEVITREELERDVWRGALVGYDAVTSTIIKLRRALKDDARQPRIIVTVPKKGYQLVAPVHFAHQAIDHNQPVTSIPNTPNPTRSRLVIFAGLFLLVFGAVVIWKFVAVPVGQQSVVPSLLVLPFETIGGDEEHEVFVDGITEDIITDLSRLANLLVLSSNITFKYRGQKVTLQSLQKELNVDFVVQGSVRRVGQEMRINVQLVNARTGVNLWAERYDRKLEDVFSVQDEITDKLIDTLSIKLTSVEKQRLAQRTTNNLMAYDFFLEGQRISKEGTQQANQLAAEAYRKAIEQDATYGRAFSALAFILAVDFRRGWTDAPIETLDRALALAEQGVALDDSIPHTYWGLGYVHLMRKEFTKAEQAAAKSISIAPNYADGYGLLALIYNNLGEPEKAVKFVEKGMKINPYYTWDYLFNLGWAHYMLGNQDKAIEALEKAQQRNESVIPIKLILAASYAQAGRQDDAEWTVDQLLILNPMTTLSHTDNAMPIAKPELKQQLLDDLRKAGLPE